jgi:hypothetical protein
MSSINEVRQMYRGIKLLKNPVCRECNPKNKNPMSIWHVGCKFPRDKYKILFVGKTGRGYWGKPNKSGYVFATRTDVDNRFFESEYPYWSYTRDIVSNVYGSPENGWDRIAFTNIIKCTDTLTVDQTGTSVKNNCILNLGVIQKEIEVLKPKNVIFYTGPSYDNYTTALIKNLKVSFKAQKIVSSKRSIKSGSENGNTLKFDQKELIDKKGKTIMRFLITSHPERQKKERFIRNTVRWIQRGIKKNKE